MTQQISYPRAWKVYSVLVIVIDVLTIIFGGLTFSNVTTGAISLVFCAPLIGYSWQRPVGARWLGKVGFIMGVLSFPVFLAFYSGKFGVGGVLATFVIYLLMAPYIYASYQFGFRSEHLWSNRIKGAGPL